MSLEPGVGELAVGDGCLVGIPLTNAQITKIDRHDPRAELGWLPRPELALGLRLLDGHEELPEGGFTLYLPPAEPVAIEPLDGRKADVRPFSG